MQVSDKRIVQEIVAVLAAKGISHAVISPGSRNAPLIITLSRHAEIECLSIPDERSAAYFALGMARQLCKPVILVCTSGTAVLNYAPAIAEAYYQQIPLIVITADRPAEWIDQADNQAIRQDHIYRNFVKATWLLPSHDGDAETAHVNRIMSEAYNTATAEKQGPVHLNVPLREPLYGLEEIQAFPPRLIEPVPVCHRLPKDALEDLRMHMKQAAKLMILVEERQVDTDLSAILERIGRNSSVVVLAESLGNAVSSNTITAFDRILVTLNEAAAKDFRPDLLISFGKHLISKRLKQFLRANKPAEHWRLDFSDTPPDTYQCLTKTIPMEASAFFREIETDIHVKPSGYRTLWHDRNLSVHKRHGDYLKSAPWSDLKVFEQILAAIPPHSDLYLGNSSPVRYAQLFPALPKVAVFGNRGTSGIDGCTSMAAGAAWISQRVSTLITGDISFLHNSNALWNQYLSDLLKIIVIQNGGGGIFRLIPGPDKLPECSTFFETRHTVQISHLAKAYAIDHLCCDSTETLQSALSDLYRIQGPAILEIVTSAEINTTVYQGYFDYLKTR
ncbi:2-succinyl-5-enolpyruvyl-6-hydroxy-3-cyclohexene-1-carboxylic-acid synthase [bacterium]|nr:2-succinyl-5-enolpyruvyl-6-hydroxy-3-cyclohexene-1-carboxylic-acid synthase [bacterium]